MKPFCKLFIVPFCLFFLMLCGCKQTDWMKTYGRSNKKKEVGTLLISVRPQSSIELRAGEAADPMKTIKRLSFFFFSGTGPEDKLLYSEHISGEDFSAPITLRLPVDNYSLVVVANAPHFIIEKCSSPGTLWSGFADAQAVSGGRKNWCILSKDGENQTEAIMMSNDQGPIKIEKGQFEQGNLSQINVPLASCLSRILVYGQPQISASFTLVPERRGFYCISGRSRGLYIMRQMAPLALPEMVMETANDHSNPADRYAYSPGYQEVEQSQKENFISLAEKHRYYISGALTSVSNLVSLPESKSQANLRSVYVYDQETTIDVEHQKYNLFIPRLIVAFRLFPSVLSQRDPAFDPRQGWASFEGCYTTGAELLRYLKALKAGDANPLLPKGFPESFAAVARKHLLAAPIWRENGQELMAFNINGVSFYEQCYNYYILPMRHKPSGKSSEYATYGLVRNFSYNIEVKRIDHLGLASVPDFSKDVSEYKEPVGISFGVSIVNPTEVDQEVSF